MNNLYKKLSKEAYSSVWLIFLHISPYATNTLKKEFGGTKSDFEKWLGLNTPNRNFRKWFEDMISEGIIVSVGNRLIKGNEHETFLALKKKIEERMRQPLINQITVRFYQDNDILFNPPSLKEQRKIFKGVRYYK